MKLEPTHLWPPEIEAMREEARASVATGFEVIYEMIGHVGPYPDDPVERAKMSRAEFARMYAPSSEAVDREIAGVPCRVFLPDGAARARSISTSTAAA